MFEVYGTFCKIMSKENAGRLTLFVSMILWFAIGSAVGLLLSLVFPMSRMNMVLTIGSLCSIALGCVREMFVILRSE